MAKLTSSDLPTPDELRNAIAENRAVNVPAIPDRQFDDVALRSITSFDDAMRAAQEVYGEVYDASTAIGTGFDLMDTEGKDQLCGIPFLVLEMKFNWSDAYNQEFVSFLAVTEDGRRFIVNDGSTGVYRQLRAFYDEFGRNGGLLCKGGLRRSDYPATEDRPAGTTYYLNV